MLKVEQNTTKQLNNFIRESALCINLLRSWGQKVGPIDVTYKHHPHDITNFPLNYTWKLFSKASA